MGCAILTRGGPDLGVERHGQDLPGRGDIHLIHQRFGWVFAFQAKPQPLQLDEMLRRLDRELSLNSQVYRARCEQFPIEKIFLESRTH